ncbi:MAG: hypothetical protein HC860_10970 [Alkalinema sp. RU_4_3]|nr:hypothetical protein [Alkalinema sp. RU_4_3]
MDSALANQLSSEFEAAFSKILPELAQLLRKNGISETLEVSLGSDMFNTAIAARGCCLINGMLKCPCSNCQAATSKDTLGLDAESAAQLCRDVAAQLHSISSQLSSGLQQAKESFDIQLKLDPASEKSQISCEFVNGVLVC